MSAVEGKELHRAIGPQEHEEMELCAVFHMRRAARTLTSAYDRALAPSGLRVTQSSILVSMDRHQPVTVSQLAQALGLDHSTLVRNLVRLVKQGYVRDEAGQDRRTRTLTLSESGAEKVREILPLWRRAQERVLEGFGSERWREQLQQIESLEELFRDGEVQA